MSEFLRISIITPSYNQAVFIEQTISSVLSQSYPNLEYVIIDGGSTDGTVEILKQYDERIAWVSERDRGQSDALNKGMKQATGNIVGFINSDDLLAPQSLWRVSDYFRKHPDAYWVSGKCRNIDENGIEIRKSVTLYKNAWMLTRSYTALMITNYLSQPATFWRREIMDEVGFFDESLHYSMEYDLWLRIGQKYRLYTIDDYLASFRIHSASKAGSSANAPFDADLEILKRYAKGPLLWRLHAFHNALIVFFYLKILGRNMGLYSGVQRKGEQR